MEGKLERKKRIVIISPSKENYKSSENTAILRLKKKDALNCITLPSADEVFFELVYKNGMYIRDNEFLSCDSEAVEYLIEFFGDEDILELFKNDQIISYLEDENNDYRMTGIKEGIIFKLSHSDFERQAKMVINDDSSNCFVLDDFIGDIKKPIDNLSQKGIKKIFRKVWKRKM